MVQLQTETHLPEEIQTDARPAKPLKIGYAWQYAGWVDHPPTATTLHVRAVVGTLQRRGHQVRMVTVIGGKPQWSDDLEHWHPIETSQGRGKVFRLFERVVRGLQSRLHLPYLKFFESYRFAGACAQAFAGCDLIYERFWLSAYGALMAGRSLRIPVFYEVNGDLVSEYQQLGIHLSRLQWAAAHFITRQMYLKAARVIAVTEQLREITTRRWRLPASKVSTVYNGAHVELFSGAADGKDVRRQYDLGNDPLVTFVGSFQPWHGLDLLVEAFAILRRDGTPAKLVLVGDGQTRTELEGQVRRLELGDCVVFTGAVPHNEIAGFLNASQVAVVNPRQSPAAMMASPLKLFEYMAAGKAIVAPQLPNLQQILTDHQNALLVPPNNAQALANALGVLLSDEQLRNKLGKNAQVQALSVHSWERTVEQLESIFTDELEKAR